MKTAVFATAAASLSAAILLPGQFSTPAHAQAASAPSGETLFKQRCASCHAVSGKGGKVGPDLTGVVGRKAGSASYNYSTAMKASKAVWTAQALDAYLAAPTKVMPGTKMVIALSRPEDRKAVITYLAGKK